MKFGIFVVGGHSEGKASQIFYLGLKAILHYALGLRFGKVCEQNTSKTRAKRDWLAFWIFHAFFLHFSLVITRLLDTNMLVSKTRGKTGGKTRGKMKNAR